MVVCRFCVPVAVVDVQDLLYVLFLLFDSRVIWTFMQTQSKAYGSFF